MAQAAVHNRHAHWYLFLLSPFVAGIVAVKNYRVSWAKNVLWAFIVFYGFTLGISEETANSSDINRYISEFQAMYQRTLSFDQVVELYKRNDDIDVLKLTIEIGLSRFTNYAPVLTALYGFIFGFFFSRNVWFLLDRLSGKIKPLTILFLVTFILVNPFWNINGFRFWTAAQVFIYGLLPFIFEKKRKGLLIASLSFLVHFSFLIPIMVLIIYSIFGNRTIIYFAFFISSIVASNIEVKSFNKVVESNAPDALSKRTSRYRSEGYVKEYRTGTARFSKKSSWHATYYMKALNWTLTAFLILLFIQRRKLVQIDKRLKNSLCVTLLLWAFANFLTSLPSGDRFLVIAYLSALPLVIFYIHYMYREKILNTIGRLAVPLLLLFCIVATREGLYTLTFNTFIGNPIIAMFTNYAFSLNDFIK